MYVLWQWVTTAYYTEMKCNYVKTCITLRWRIIAIIFMLEVNPQPGSKKRICGRQMLEGMPQVEVVISKMIQDWSISKELNND